MKDLTKLVRNDQRYLINEEQDEVEYVAKVKDNGRKITLKRSQGSQWTASAKGEVLGKLKDHGNGIKIEFQGETLSFEYDEFAELYLLMKLKVEEDPNL